MEVVALFWEIDDSINLIWIINFGWFLFSVLHQKAKISEANAVTPRQNQEYSPPPEQNYYSGEQSPKYASKFIRFYLYY
jgi:hypothetical protein